MFDEKDRKKDNEKFGLFSFMNDNNELNEEQKEEIKNGNYDPWNFEEEDLEDDDYYFEDDKEE
jgi:hypothetical protein